MKQQSLSAEETIATLNKNWVSRCSNKAPQRDTDMSDIKDFYAWLLQLPPSWEVSEVAFGSGEDSVAVTLAMIGATQGSCPQCARSCASYRQTSLHTWHHLDTCGRTTLLRGCLSIVDCPEHGEQIVPPPWGDADSPVTGGFEGWFTEVARGMGDIRKAARLAGLDLALACRILRRSQERLAASRSEPDKVSTDAPEASSALPGRQLSLFDQGDMTLVNQGIQAFRRLELEEAVDCFRNHQQRYPKGYDVGPRIAVAERLLEGIRVAPPDPADRPAHLYGLWKSIESRAKGTGGRELALLADIKTPFFEFVLGEVERASMMDGCRLHGDVPLGLILMHAGRCDDAIASLQSRIRETPHHAGLYGYLGDGYRLRGEARIARQCYREACLVDPAGIDWDHLMDEEVKELKDDLLLEYGLNPDLAAAWLPSHARISGLFERKAVRVHEGLKEVVQEYLALEKTLKKKHDPKFAAGLFYRGLILCENPHSLRFVKTIDLIQVRRRMKELNANLFEEFLELLAAGSG
jgi:tetratricopeptide (TPR) repeat protein